MSSLIDAPDDRYISGYTIEGYQNQWSTTDYLITNVGPRLISLDVNYQIYGLPIPYSYGVRRLPGVVLWALPLEETSVTTKTKTSNWQPLNSGYNNQWTYSGTTNSVVPWAPSYQLTTTKTKTTTYEYFGNWAVVFGYAGGTGTDLLRVWADGKLIIDRRTSAKAQGDVSYRFYPGTESQDPDPLIVANSENGCASAYRGLIYIVFENVPLEQFGNKLPFITAEVADNAGEAAYQNVITQAAGTSVRTAGFAVDWNRNRAWYFDLFDSRALLEYDIFNNTFVRKISVTEEMDTHGGMAYIPWLNRVVVGKKQTSNNPTLLLVDLNSGLVESTIACAPLFGFPDGMVPIRVIGSTIETYVVMATGWNDIGVYRVIAPQEVPGYSDWTLVNVHQSQFSGSGSVNGMAPGGVYANYSEVFVNIDNVIKKVSIKPGALSTSDGLVDTVTLVDESASDAILQMYYYPAEDVLLLARANPASSGLATRWEKYSVDTGALISATADGTIMYLIGTNNFYMSDASMGTLTVASGTPSVTCLVLDIKSMTISEVSMSGTSRTRYMVSDSRSRSLVTLIPSRAFYGAVTDGRTTLAGFINAVAEDMAGYTLGTEFSVSADIDDLIDGGILFERTSFRAFLDNLSVVYRFDIVESDGVLKLIRKPTSFSAYEFTIPQEELALINEGDEEYISFQSRREDEVSLPRKTELYYIAKDLDYQVTVQFAQRSNFPIQTTSSDEILTARIPVIISDVEAKTLAYRMLYSKVWASGVSYKFRLSQKYQYLEPSDVGQITVESFTYTVSIKEVHYNADLSLSVAASAFLSEEPIVNIDADGGTVLDQELTGYVLPLMVPIDSKLLLPQFDSAYPVGLNASVFYVISPFSDATAWNGAIGEISVDGGASWVEVGSNKDIPVLGTITIAPPDTSSPHLIQEDGSFTVRLTTSNSADLASITYDELMTGYNSALVGTPQKGWEVVQFKDVTANADGTYTLSYLVRGRRGTDIFTEAAVKPASVGAWFILLRGEWVEVSHLAISLAGSNIRYRVTPFGDSTQSSIIQSFSFDAESAKPLAPSHVEMAWSGSDIDLSFIRQTRGESEWEDGTEEVSLVEATENFRVTLYTDGTFATASTTIDLDNSDETAGKYHATITAAMLSSAYGTSTPSTIYVGAKQYSEYLSAYGDERLVSLITGV